jgi:hypothetical protein
MVEGCRVAEDMNDRRTGIQMDPLVTQKVPNEIWTLKST